MERKLLLQPARPGLRQLLRLETPERDHPRQGTLPEYFGPLKQTGLVDHGHDLVALAVVGEPAVLAQQGLDAAEVGLRGLG